MSSDALKSKVITDKSKLFTDCTFGQIKNLFIFSDSISQTIIFNILLNNKGNCKNSFLFCFPFRYLQSVSVPVPHNIGKPQAQNIRYSKSEVSFQDNLKNEMAERKVESLSTDRYTVRWTEVLTSKFSSKEFKKVYENLYTAFLRQTRSRRFSISA